MNSPSAVRLNKKNYSLNINNKSLNGGFKTHLELTEDYSSKESNSKKDILDISKKSVQISDISEEAEENQNC